MKRRVSVAAIFILIVAIVVSQADAVEAPRTDLAGVTVGG